MPQLALEVQTLRRQTVYLVPCREVHTRYNALGDPNPTVNLALVFFVILAGMGVVLGIPYLMYGRKAGQVKSWTQQLEDSRKVRVGHVS